MKTTINIPKDERPETLEGVLELIENMVSQHPKGSKVKLTADFSGRISSVVVSSDG